MSPALAVILLLNGVQVEMARPALLIAGAAFVPLRAVCERVGVTVHSAGQTLVIDGRDGKRAFDRRPWRDASAGAVCVDLDGTTYLRARALATALGGQCHWDSTRRELALSIPWGGARPLAASPREILQDPLSWRGKPVRLSGVWEGPAPLRLSPTAATGLPGDGPSGWLGTGAASLRCWMGGARQPTDLCRVGEAVSVTGTVAVDQSGSPYIACSEWIHGGSPACGLLWPDQGLFRGGEDVPVWALSTPGAGPPRGWRFCVWNPAGELQPGARVDLWSDDQGGLEDQGVCVLRLRLPPGSTRESSGVWVVAREVPVVEDAVKATFILRNIPSIHDRVQGAADGGG